MNDPADGTERISGEERLRALLGRTVLFRDIPSSALDLTLQWFYPRDIAAGTVVIRQGDAGDELFLVETGQLEVRAVLGGQDVRLGRLGPGEVFGEVALLRRRSRTATVTTTTPARLWTLSREGFVAIVRAVPEIAHRLREIMRQRELANALRALQ